MFLSRKVRFFCNKNIQQLWLIELMLSFPESGFKQSLKISKNINEIE